MNGQQIEKDKQKKEHPATKTGYEKKKNENVGKNNTLPNDRDQTRVEVNRMGGEGSISGCGPRTKIGARGRKRSKNMGRSRKKPGNTDKLTPKKTKKQKRDIQ